MTINPESHFAPSPKHNVNGKFKSTHALKGFVRFINMDIDTDDLVIEFCTYLRTVYGNGYKTPFQGFRAYQYKLSNRNENKTFLFISRRGARCGRNR